MHRRICKHSYSRSSGLASFTSLATAVVAGCYSTLLLSEYSTKDECQAFNFPPAVGILAGVPPPTSSLWTNPIAECGAVRDPAGWNSLSGKCAPGCARVAGLLCTPGRCRRCITSGQRKAKDGDIKKSNCEECSKIKITFSSCQKCFVIAQLLFWFLICLRWKLMPKIQDAYLPKQWLILSVIIDSWIVAAVPLHFNSKRLLCFLYVPLGHFHPSRISVLFSTRHLHYIVDLLDYLLQKLEQTRHLLVESWSPVQCTGAAHRQYSVLLQYIYWIYFYFIF